MKTNILRVSNYAPNQMCKTVQKHKKDSVLYTIIASLFIFMLSSCENHTSIKDSLITATGEVTTRSTSQKEELSEDNSPVIFTGNDIHWFNPQTREIRFKKNIDPTTLKTYQKIHFRLNDNILFTAQTYASQYHSFGISDLVLFIDIATRKCYLHDCYPVSILENDPNTKKNKEKRAGAWNAFIKQLKAEDRIN